MVGKRGIYGGEELSYVGLRWVGETGSYKSIQSGHVIRPSIIRHFNYSFSSENPVVPVSVLSQLN